MSAQIEAIAPAQSVGRGRGIVRVVRSVIQRLIQLVVVVVLIVTGTALLVRLVPGDPALAILGLRATAQDLAALRAQLGLDKPFLVQVIDQVGAIARGDFGTSLRTGQPVAEILGQALPVTLLLVFTAILFSLLLSLPLGLLPALGIRRRGTQGLRIAMVVLIAIPSFLIGLYLLQLFGVQLHLAPIGGWSTEWPAVLRYVWLPSLALALFISPIFVRSIERETTDLMGEEFVETAISRGIPRTALVLRHILPNVLLPVITLVGFSIAVLLGGAVIVESLYGIPGVGEVVTRAVGQRDYPVIVGVTVFTGILTVAISLVTDVLYALADPRVRIR